MISDKISLSQTIKSVSETLFPSVFLAYFTSVVLQAKLVSMHVLHVNQIT